MHLPIYYTDNISQGSIPDITGTSSGKFSTLEKLIESPKHTEMCVEIYNESTNEHQVHQSSKGCRPKRKKGGILKRAPLHIYKGASHLGAAMARQDEEMDTDDDSVMFEQDLIDDDEMIDQNYKDIEPDFIGRHDDMEIEDDVFGTTNPNYLTSFGYFENNQGLRLRAHTLDETNGNYYSGNENGNNISDRRYSSTPGETHLNNVNTKTETTEQTLGNVNYDNEGNYVPARNVNTDLILFSPTESKSTPNINSFQDETYNIDPKEVTQSQGNIAVIHQYDYTDNDNQETIAVQNTYNSNLESAPRITVTKSSNDPVSKPPTFTRLQSDPGVTREPESVLPPRPRTLTSSISSLKRALQGIVESRKDVKDSAEFEELIVDEGDDEDE